MRAFVVDASLHAAERSVGVDLGREDKCAIARTLDAAGVDEIETGSPAYGAPAHDDLRALLALGLTAAIAVPVRVEVPHDLSAAAACGATRVHLGIALADVGLAAAGRDRAWALAQIERGVAEACAHGMQAVLCVEDAVRTDPDFLLRAGECARRAGARRLRVVDGLGQLDAFAACALFARLRAATDLKLEIAASDDFGQAVAVTLGAMRGGATHVNLTTNGLGERAGRAALAATVLALRQAGWTTGVAPSALYALAQRVAQATGRAVPANAPVVGDAVFAHESGIHVSGLLRDAASYQALDPAELGRSHRIVLGKHSGGAALRWACEHWGLRLDEAFAPAVLELVRAHATRTKSAPGRDEVHTFIAGVAARGVPAARPAVTAPSAAA